ncbi:MAG: hypothetical protein Q9165_003759 [Trypethelium subeluteriae]
MGLGKSLSMIALIAAGKVSSIDHRHFQHDKSLNSTLIVVPPNGERIRDHASQIGPEVLMRYSTVLVEWEAQIESRFKPTANTETPDIVLTTYQTVESEQRKRRLGNDSILSFHWNRIVLDEGMIQNFVNDIKDANRIAHLVRNFSTATAKVVASIHATYRWAMSGTPIQNSLTDFFGLLKFLRFHPYDNTQKFDDDLSKSWRSGDVEVAVERFKKLLSCIMLRRSKQSTIELPSRDDQIIRIPFSPEEKAYYRNIEQPVVELLDDASKTRHSMGGLWLNAMQQIQQLRVACNVGVGKRSLNPAPMRSGIVSGDMTLDILGARLSMGATFYGNVSPSKRKRALKLLRDDLETRAILLTISCGAVGIDLTAASRIHLLEPQWNPSLEDQALARVHRIGQTRPVTTIRYVMQDSIEEHIINVQDRKKLLASLLLSNESSSQVSRQYSYTFTRASGNVNLSSNLGKEGVRSFEMGDYSMLE